MRFNVGNEKAISFYDWIKTCEAIVGKKAKIINFNYKAYNRKVREFFPFYDYDNVLDTQAIKVYWPSEIDFKKGLKGSYDWYLKNKDKILLRKEVLENEKEILKTLDDSTL
jgi:nucleoside-diphosphate-sugar epimerase